MSGITTTWALLKASTQPFPHPPQLTGATFPPPYSLHAHPVLYALVPIQTNAIEEPALRAAAALPAAITGSAPALQRSFGRIHIESCVSDGDVV